MTALAPERPGSLDSHFSHVLAALRGRSLELFGVREATFETLLRVARPYSEVRRVRVAGAVRSPLIYVKVFRPRTSGPDEVAFMQRRVAGDFAATKRAHDAFSSAHELAVPRPVAAFPDLLALVTEEAAGVPLADALERQLRFTTALARLQSLMRAMHRVGQWIDLFQRAEGTRGQLDWPEVCEYIDIRLRRIVTHSRSPISAADRTDILAALDRCWDGVPDSERRQVAVHGDLALGNVLVADSCVTVLDLAMVGTGSIYHDLAHMHMQLGLLQVKPMFRPRAVRMLQDALLQGYSNDVSAERPLFQVMLCQHVACHLSGLLFRPASPLARIYNGWVARRHGRWLRQFARN